MRESGHNCYLGAACPHATPERPEGGSAAVTHAERAEERDSLAQIEEQNEAGNDRPWGTLAQDAIRTLINEVKELRKKLDAATAPYPEAFEAGRQAAARIKQMEEALRHIGDVCSDTEVQATIDIALNRTK